MHEDGDALCAGDLTLPLTWPAPKVSTGTVENVVLTVASSQSCDTMGKPLRHLLAMKGKQ